MLKKLTAFFTATVMACATPLACNAEVIKHEVNVPPWGFNRRWLWSGRLQ